MMLLWGIMQGVQNVTVLTLHLETYSIFKGFFEKCPKPPLRWHHEWEWTT